MGASHFKNPKIRIFPNYYFEWNNDGFFLVTPPGLKDDYIYPVIRTLVDAAPSIGSLYSILNIENSIKSNPEIFTVFVDSFEIKCKSFEWPSKERLLIEEVYDVIEIFKLLPVNIIFNCVIKFLSHPTFGSKYPLSVKNILNYITNLLISYKSN